MGYVWLKYTGEQPQIVSVIKSIDGKKFEPANLKVKEGDVFLCTELTAHDYTSDWAMENGFFAEEFDMEEERWANKYYEKWKDFDVRRKALLHYLCEREKDHIFGTYGLEFGFFFDSIFSRIKEKHHEYLPKEQITSLDFSDILESLKRDKYIRYYPGTILHKIVILNDFYKIPEIKKAKDEYEVKQNEKYSRMNKDIKGFHVFPSKENPRIQLNGSVVILGDKVIDLNNKEDVEKIKNDYEKFESNTDEIKKSGKNALNETIKGNFYIALRILLSALDKGVGIHDKEGECKFKLEQIKNVYEQYGRDLLKDYVNSVSFNIDNVKKRKASVNALLRRAKVGMKGDQCIQLDNLPKSNSPKEENGWYIIKMMDKITRDGKKTTIDGKKTRDYGKKIK